MLKLDIHNINKTSAYNVVEAGAWKYEFITRTGVAYLVGFMEDSMVEEYESYQF